MGNTLDTKTNKNGIGSSFITKIYFEILVFLEERFSGMNKLQIALVSTYTILTVVLFTALVCHILYTGNRI